MKKPKNKGFTLIEIIITIAVFAIVTVSISFTTSTSSKMYKQETVKYETITAANSIVEQLKSKGTTSSISGLQAFFTGANTEEYRYIYFNYENPNELSTIPLITTNYNVTNDVVGDFSTCSLNNAHTKELGAWVKFSRQQSSNIDANGLYNADWYYNVYTIDVKVWNFKQGESSMSETSASISR